MNVERITYKDSPTLNTKCWRCLNNHNCYDCDIFEEIINRLWKYENLLEEILDVSIDKTQEL